MAEYVSPCSKDVHIPQCDDPRCSHYLKKLEEMLTQKGCSCTEEYPMNGPWKENYKENFSDSCYTIIHICQSLWTLMSQLPSEDLAPKHHNKLICILFAKKGPIDKKEYNGFFKPFQIQVIPDGKSIADFAQRFIKDLGKSPSSPSPHNNSSVRLNCPYGSGHTGYINNSVEDREMFEKLICELATTGLREANKSNFNTFPDEFGRVKDRETFVRIQFPNDLENKIMEMSPLADLRQLIDKFKDATETTSGNLFLTLYKILPMLYDTRDSIKLANIVPCNQIILQNSAITKLELLVLQKFIYPDIAKLKETELIVAQSLSKMSVKYKNASHGKTAQLMTLERLCNLLLMLHCQVITYSHDEADEMDTFNETVKTCLDIKKDHCIASISKVVKFIKSSRSMIMGAEAFTEFNERQAGELSKQNKLLQIFVVIRCLMEIFSKPPVQVGHYLNFLNKYLNARWPFQHVPRCSHLIFHGMVFYLACSMRAALDFDIRSICSGIMNCIIKTYRPDSSDEANRKLHSLLFENIPTIRQGVIELFKSKKLYKYKKMTHCFLNEIVHLLSPLLVIDPRVKMQHNETQWKTIVGTFGDQQVILLFHLPNETDHWEGNTARFRQTEDNMHQNQITRLQNLRHPYIVSLLAYQLTSLPQFYIIEDFTTKNLQTALKNRNDNRGYFSPSTLTKFLCDLAEALEYCHNAGIIHRNLTAASLFIVGDDMLVKLAGFELAEKACGNVNKIFERDEKIAVPTRWTAPESLRRLIFSRATDIWMFGHVAYEILTHGVLPYSQCDLDDETLVQKFFLDIACSAPLQLEPETCLNRDHYEIILNCANVHAKERPDIATIKTLLQTFNNQSTGNRPRYPNLHDGHRKPSTSMKKGIPNVFSKIEHRSLEGYLVQEVTPTFAQYRLNDAFVFREIINGKISEKVLSKLKTGNLDNIFPWVQCTDRSLRVSVIDSYIPAACRFCILDQTREKYLGHSLQNYMKVLLQVALMLKDLHDDCIVLGDMCASTLFMDQINGSMKVYVASLAYISGNGEQRQQPVNGAAFQRSAPEVKSRGFYSKASDVFCFGHLIQQVVTAFDNNLLQEPSTNTNNLNRPELFEVNTTKSRLQEIINMCSTSDMNKRAKIKDVIDALRRFIDNLTEEDYASFESFSLVSSETKPMTVASSRVEAETISGSRNGSQKVLQNIVHKNSNDSQSSDENNTAVKTPEGSSSSNSNTAVNKLYLASSGDSNTYVKKSYISNSGDSNTSLKKSYISNSGDSNTSLKKSYISNSGDSNTYVKTLNSSADNNTTYASSHNSNTVLETQADSSSDDGNTAIYDLNSNDTYTEVASLHLFSSENDPDGEALYSSASSKQYISVKSLDASSTTAVQLTKCPPRVDTQGYLCAVEKVVNLNTFDEPVNNVEQDDNSITLVKKTFREVEWEQWEVHSQSHNRNVSQEHQVNEEQDNSMTLLMLNIDSSLQDKNILYQKPISDYIQHKNIYDGLQFQSNTYPLYATLTGLEPTVENKHEPAQEAHPPSQNQKVFELHI